MSCSAKPLGDSEILRKPRLNFFIKGCFSKHKILWEGNFPM